MNIVAGSVRSVVYQAAEKTIIDASCFVFANAGKREAIDSNSEVLGISESNDTDPSNHGEGPSSTCAVKVLKFFIDILQKSCDEGKAVNGGQAKRALPSATANAINIATGGNSGGNIGSQNTRHNDIIDTETRNLLFAIKAINAIFLADGNLDGSRALISKYVNYDSS